MFIYVEWKDPPELSMFRRRSSADSNVIDESMEKLLLVNPYCPVRIMLEFIRNRCKLGTFTDFDLCDESGGLLGLFNLPTFVYAHDLFVHKRLYYVVVLKVESEKTTTVLPQLNFENPLYEVIHDRVKKYLTTGDVTPIASPPLPAQSKPAKDKKKGKSGISS